MGPTAHRALRVPPVGSAQEAPPAGSPTGLSTRYALGLPRPLAQAVSQICANDNDLLGRVLPSPPPVVHYGCAAFHEQADPAGSVWVSTSRSGVSVEGWVIDPATDGAMDLTLAGNGTTVTVHADNDDARSAVPWPGFGTKHGFHATLPFDGTAGPHEICLSAPGRILSNGTSALGCAKYDETPTVFLDEKGYPIAMPAGSLGVTTSCAS